MSHFYEQPTEAYLETSSEKYEVTRVLGKGGTADILLARHRHSGSPLVIKVPLQEVPYAVRALKREAKALQCLQHDHIIRMYEYSQWEMLPALMLAYAPYGDVRHYYHISAKGVPLPIVIDLIRQVAAAIDYMHMKGFVHRDIKPDNMLLLSPQHMVLSDLGLAVPERLLPSLKRPMGTVRYMAPEQIEGSPCRASDQYAVAVVTYELLCARAPFIGTIDEVMYQHSYTSPPSLQGPAVGLPIAIEHVLHKAMEKDPDHRFATVEEFYLELRHSKTKLYLQSGGNSDSSAKKTLKSSTINTVQGPVPVPASVQAISPLEYRQKQTESPVRRYPYFRLLDLFLFALIHLIAIVLVGGLHNPLLLVFNAILLLVLRLNRTMSTVIYSIEVAILLVSFVIGNSLHSLIVFDFYYLICLLPLICLSVSLRVAPLYKIKDTT
jgi:serine/threonine protein kinase